MGARGKRLQILRAGGELLEWEREVSGILRRLGHYLRRRRMLEHWSLRHVAEMARRDGVELSHGTLIAMEHMADSAAPMRASVNLLAVIWLLYRAYDGTLLLPTTRTRYQVPIDVGSTVLTAVRHGYRLGVQIEDMTPNELLSLWQTLTPAQQGRTLAHRPRSPLWCVGWTQSRFGSQIRYSLPVLDAMLADPARYETPCLAGLLALVDRLAWAQMEHAPYGASVQLERHRDIPTLYRLTGAAYTPMHHGVDQALHASLAVTQESLRLARLSLAGARIVAVMP